MHTNHKPYSIFGHTDSIYAVSSQGHGFTSVPEIWLEKWCHYLNANIIVPDMQSKQWPDT